MLNVVNVFTPLVLNGSFTRLVEGTSDRLLLWSLLKIVYLIDGRTKDTIDRLLSGHYQRPSAGSMAGHMHRKRLLSYRLLNFSCMGMVCAMCLQNLCILDSLLSQEVGRQERQLPTATLGIIDDLLLQQ